MEKELQKNDNHTWTPEQRQYVLYFLNTYTHQWMCMHRDVSPTTQILSHPKKKKKKKKGLKARACFAHRTWNDGGQQAGENNTLKLVAKEGSIIRCYRLFLTSLTRSCMIPRPMTEYRLRSSGNRNSLDSLGLFYCELEFAVDWQRPLRNGCGGLQHFEEMEVLKAPPWGFSG